VGEHELPAAPPVQAKHAGEKVDPEKINETVEEIRFYLEHGMPEQAATAFEKLQTFTGDETILASIEREIQSASQHTEAAEEVTSVENISEFATDEPSAEFTVDEVPAVVEATPEPEAPAAEFEVAEVETAEVEAPVHHIEPAAAEPAAAELPAVASAPGVLQEFVTDLESSLGDSFLPGTIAHEAKPREHASAKASQPEHAKPELEPIGNAAPTTFGVPQAEPMGEFVADLEASLGEDFLQGAPVAEPEPAQPAARIEAPVAATPAQHWPTPTPAQPVSAPVASAAAASSSGAPTISQQAPALAPQQPAVPKPPISPIIPNAAAAKSPFGEDAGVDLAEMFGELKHDLEVGASTTEEDPETHYNLGIAFREMGLLEEAIGEFQKVAQANDRGKAFRYAMQCCTLLGLAFMEKGQPAIAAIWYERALLTPGMDTESKLALRYDLGVAQESAGELDAALKSFSQVYAINIDYRDVAERIHSLQKPAR
jgi:hypothetical protein